MLFWREGERLLPPQPPQNDENSVLKQKLAVAEEQIIKLQTEYKAFQTEMDAKLALQVSKCQEIEQKLQGLKQSLLSFANSI